MLNSKYRVSNSEKEVDMSQKLTTNQLLTRYAITGGAIGFYFGFFFRPARQASLFVAIGLAILITVVMTGIKIYRDRPSLSALVKAVVFTFLKACLFLILLEMRHPLYDYGGKLAVTIFMMLIGALAGLWYAYDQIRQRGRS
ncbi:MAG: hypothetical protein R3293_10695 [Candidatus Promineifilaceae bacterium]|nr:hypothetical protein [Candidatus Promineifilaceae bacterium]